jgi:hypothetical protein
MAIFGAMIDPGQGSAWVDCYAFGSDSYVRIRTNDQERMRIDHSGNVTVTGDIITSGYINGTKDHIVMPLVLGASKVLTTSYQAVTWNTQGINDAFAAIAGRSPFYNMSGWYMYWVVACKFLDNPTTIRGALYYYTGTWQYHPSTYTKTAYALGINYMAWGPWPVDQVGTGTFTLHLKLDAGSGQTVGEADGGTSYLVFRRA